MITADFVIVGAGPAGLTSAIKASRQGLTSIILEKGNTTGPKPRGETIHYHELLDDVLGDGYIESISKYETPIRIYHSPGDKLQTKMSAKSKSFVFEWEKLIERLTDSCDPEKVSIELNAEVIEPIEENGICVGVKYQKEGKIESAKGKIILACDGYDSILGAHYGVDYFKINNPIIKCLVSNANIDLKEHPGFEFFLIPIGGIDEFPTFPPCVAFMFPRGGKEIEVGLMIFKRPFLKMKDIALPSENEIMSVWADIKQNYPGFSAFLKGGKIEHEELTSITSAGMIKNFIPNPGIVLVGDSAGFIESSGSSGLYSSMKMAEFWVNMLSPVINDSKLWQQESINDYNARFKKTEIFKHIKGTYRLTDSFFGMVFSKMRTSEKINENWYSMMKLLSKSKS